MRYRWAVLLMLGAALTLPLTQLHADEDSMGPRGSGESHWGHHREWEDELGLTHEQKAKLKSLWESEETEMKPLWRKLRDLKIKLHDLVDDKAADSDIKSTLDQVKTAAEALREKAESFRKEKDAVLTPTQEARMLLEHMHHRGHPTMMEHRMWDHMRHHEGDEDEDRADDDTTQKG